MLKEAREMKEKWLLMLKKEASSRIKMIEQAKAAIESEKMQQWQN
jgi:hypothetical protein